MALSNCVGKCDAVGSIRSEFLFVSNLLEHALVSLSIIRKLLHRADWKTGTREGICKRILFTILVTKLASHTTRVIVFITFQVMKFLYGFPRISKKITFSSERNFVQRVGQISYPVDTLNNSVWIFSKLHTYTSIFYVLILNIKY